MDDKQQVRLMRDVQLKDILAKSEDKMLYIFDFLVMWTFFVEVVSFGTKQAETSYPTILLSVGDAPAQDSKSAEDLFGTMKSEKIGEEDYDEEDEFGNFSDFGNDEYPSY